jgi:hypothetical protein
VYLFIFIVFFAGGRYWGLNLGPHGLPFELFFQHFLHWLFGDGMTHFLGGMAWTLILLLMLPHVAGMSDACHHNQPFVDMGSCEIFGGASILPISASQVVRITGMSHCTWLSE